MKHYVLFDSKEAAIKVLGSDIVPTKLSQHCSMYKGNGCRSGPRNAELSSDGRLKLSTFVSGISNFIEKDGYVYCTNDSSNREVLKQNGFTFRR